MILRRNHLGHCLNTYTVRLEVRISFLLFTELSLQFLKNTLLEKLMFRRKPPVTFPSSSGQNRGWEREERERLGGTGFIYTSECM